MVQGLRSSTASRVPSMTDFRTHLRLQIRQRRQSLSAFEQQTASQQLIHTFASLPEVTAAQRIACILPMMVSSILNH